LLRRVLVGDGPAGRPAGRAELALLRDLVHLHHHAVDFVRRVVPVLGVVGDVLADPGHVGYDLVQVADRQAPAAQPLVPARLRVRRPFEVPLVAGAGGGAADAGFAGGASLAGFAGGAGGVRRTLDPADAVDDSLESPGGGHPRVLLAQRPGGRVPRVG